MRGRWANERTCCIYINEATAALSSSRFSDATQELVAKCRRHALSFSLNLEMDERVVLASLWAAVQAIGCVISIETE